MTIEEGAVEPVREIRDTSEAIWKALKRRNILYFILSKLVKISLFLALIQGNALIYILWIIL